MTSKDQSMAEKLERPEIVDHYCSLGNSDDSRTINPTCDRNDKCPSMFDYPCYSKSSSVSFGAASKTQEISCFITSNYNPICLGKDKLSNVESYLSTRRKGKLLTRERVLNSDIGSVADHPIRQPKPLSDNNLFPSAIRLSNIFSILQPTLLALTMIIASMFKAPGLSVESSARSDGIWINTRPEPVIYIDGEPFVIRKSDAYATCVFYEPESYPLIENLEAHLVEEIRQELFYCSSFDSKDIENFNNLSEILVHSADVHLVPMWKKLKNGIASIQTSKDFFESNLPTNVQYYRAPLCLDNEKSILQFLDFVTERIVPYSSDNIIIALQGNTGGDLHDMTTFFAMTVVGLSTMYDTNFTRYEAPASVNATSELQYSLNPWIKHFNDQIHLHYKNGSEYLMCDSDTIYSKNHVLYTSIYQALHGDFHIFKYLYARLKLEDAVKAPVDAVMASMSIEPNDNLSWAIVSHRYMYHITKNSSFIEQARKALRLYMMIQVYAAFLMGEWNMTLAFPSKNAKLLPSVSSWLKHREDISMLWHLIQYSFSVEELFKPINELPCDVFMSSCSNLYSMEYITRRDHVVVAGDLDSITDERSVVADHVHHILPSSIKIGRDKNDPMDVSFKQSLYDIPLLFDFPNSKLNSNSTCIVENFRYMKFGPIYAMAQPHTCSPHYKKAV